MEVFKLTQEVIGEAASRAAEVLRTGGIVLYPTDTLYGLGADALSDEAVAKVKRIKGRDEGKPIHAIVSDLDMAERYGELTDDTRLLVSRLPQGQATYIVKKKSGLDAGVVKDIATFGFRIPANEFCIQMIREFGKPITATSANRSGEQPQRSVEKILAQLGPAAKETDLVIDAGELPERQPSTVVDISSAKPTIVREGAISAADVWNAIRDEV